MRMPIAGLALLLLAACSSGSDDARGEGGEADSSAMIEGPFPKTITGALGYSFPHEDGSGDIELGLLEHDHAAFILSSSVYAAKGLEEEDDVDVTLTISPLPAERCAPEVRQCFKGE